MTKLYDYLNRPTLWGNPSIFEDITPSDTDELVPRYEAIYVETGGTVVLEDDKGNLWSKEVNNDTTICLRVKRVRASGTDATGIKGLR